MFIEVFPGDFVNITKVTEEVDSLPHHKFRGIDLAIPQEIRSLLTGTLALVKDVQFVSLTENSLLYQAILLEVGLGSKGKYDIWFLLNPWSDHDQQNLPSEMYPQSGILDHFVPT